MNDLNLLLHLVCSILFPVLVSKIHYFYVYCSLSQKITVFYYSDFIKLIKANHKDKNDNFTKRKRNTTRNAQPTEKIQRVVSGPRPFRDSPLPCARFVYSDVSSKGLRSKEELLQGRSSSSSWTASSSSSSSQSSGSALPYNEGVEIFISRPSFLNCNVDSDSSDNESAGKSQKISYNLNQCSVPVFN